jgi:hypothetical protein
MLVCIDKQAISWQNCLTYLVFARERTPLLTSVVSADNITVCREQRVAGELLVDGAYYKMSFKIIVSFVLGKMWSRKAMFFMWGSIYEDEIRRECDMHLWDEISM